MYFFFKKKARELKSVHVTVGTAWYLKLLMHKCHVNKLNHYNQVRLRSIFTTRLDYVFYFYNQVRLRVLFLQPG